MTGTELLGSWEQTPRLTDHARERCAQMGISTKVAKRLWQTRTLIRADRNPDRVLVSSVSVPDYVLVVDQTGWFGQDEVPVVITVLFACGEEYVREGETFRVVS